MLSPFVFLQTIRTVLLFTAAFVFGAAGWSGKTSLNFLALLYPFVYLQSRRRLDALSSAVYYAGATWSVIPGSESFFDTGGNLVLPLLIWTLLVALSAAPWMAFYNRRFLPLATIAAIIALSIPPFSLVTVAHPLISVAQWFPGTRWFGLCLPLVLILAYRRLGTAFTFSSARRSVARGTCSFPPSTARSAYRCREHSFRRSIDTRHDWLHIARPGRGHAAHSSRAPRYAHPFSGVDHPYLESNARSTLGRELSLN